MSAFTEFINQQAKETQNNNNNEVEYYTPKNPVIRLGKQKDGSTKDSILVRILPPKKEGSLEFYKKFRNTGINFNNKNNEQKFVGLTLPATSGESVIDPFIESWIANKVPFSRFPNRPSNRYYIEVIEYINNGGTLQPVVDNSGNPKISPLEIPITAYNALASQLGDEMFNPSPSAKFSFISEDIAYPVMFKKAKENDKTNWYVQVYSNPQYQFGNLPSNWRELSSDLDKLAQPTEEVNPNLVNFLINKVNGTPLETDNFTFNRDTNTLGDAPSQPQQPVQQTQQPQPTQQQVEQQLPGNLSNQPQQNTQQVPQNDWNTINTQSQQATQQPTQQQQFNQVQQTPQQPQQPQGNNPWENFDENTINDSQVPFDTGSQQQPPQQQNVQQNQQQYQEPPKMEQPKNVDDVLKGLNLDI